MKTTFSINALMMTVMLSFILLSCNKEEMLQPDKQALTGSSAATSKTPEDMYQIDEKLQIDLKDAQAMEAKVIEVVKPVKEVVEKLLNADKTGTYEAYKKDAKRLSTLKDPEENRILVEKIFEKYLGFFQEIWRKADIDEKAYQMKIKNIFPEEVQETIEFTEFLNFSTRIKKPARDIDPSPAPPAPPAPAPAPENICIDAARTWFGIKFVENSVFSVAHVYLSPNSINTHAVAEVLGLSRAQGAIASNITIPGTFPDDSKLLRVKKSFRWSGYATSISIIGFSIARAQYSTVMNEEEICMWAPVTWVATKSFDEMKTEEYVIQKRFMYNIRYGVSAFCSSFSELAALSFAESNCTNFTWSVCEE